MGTLTVKREDTQAILAIETRSSKPNAQYGSQILVSEFVGDKTFKCGMDASNPIGKYMAHNLIIGDKTLQCAGDYIPYDIKANYQKGFVQGLLTTGESTSISNVSFLDGYAVVKGSTNSTSVYAYNSEGTRLQLSNIASNTGYTNPYVGRTTNRVFIMLGRRNNTTGSKYATSWDINGTRVESTTEYSQFLYQTVHTWTKDSGGTLGNGSYAVCIGGFSTPSQGSGTPSTASSNVCVFNEDMTWTHIASGARNAVGNLYTVECSDGSIIFSGGKKSSTYYSYASKIDSNFTTTALTARTYYSSGTNMACSLGGNAGFIYGTHLELYDIDGTKTIITLTAPQSNFYTTNSHGNIENNLEIITDYFNYSTQTRQADMYQLDGNGTLSSIDTVLTTNPSSGSSLMGCNFTSDKDELIFVGLANIKSSIKYT